MRDFKFRAWDLDAEQMYSRESIKTLFDEHLEHERIKIMQYTGLKDRNGQEIYEGDVLQATNAQSNKVVGQVYWNYGCWEVKQYVFKELNNIEVIGNTYEHPHLLEGESS